MAKVSDLELYLDDLIKSTEGLPKCVREYKFDKKRGWRFDFAFPSVKVAIECEGLTYTGGRHQRPEGYSNDCEKYNEAAIQDWKVFRFTQAFMMDSACLKQFKNTKDPAKYFMQLKKIIDYAKEANRKMTIFNKFNKRCENELSGELERGALEALALLDQQDTPQQKRSNACEAIKIIIAVLADRSDAEQKLHSGENYEVFNARIN